MKELCSVHVRKSHGNNFGFFLVLFLLEIAVSYWLSLLLFHILSQSESLKFNSQ
jgi:hypothetical protein